MPRWNSQLWPRDSNQIASDKPRAVQGATTRSIITILNAWRAAGIVDYDTDRAILTIIDRAAIEARLSQG